MYKSILTIMFWVSSATAQTIIPGGVPMGNTDVGTAVKRRLDRAAPTVPAKTSATSAQGVTAPPPVLPKKSNTIRAHSKQGLIVPPPTADAEITTESAPVYRGTSVQGTPVAMLKKGDRVWIDFEFKNAKTSWCSVKQKKEAENIGYLNCTDLRRIPRAR